MKHATLEKWLKFVIIGMGFCGIFVYGWGLPNIISNLCYMHPEFTTWYYPCFLFLLITAIPCYGVLIYAWRIASNIGKGNAFSYDNGEAFRGISWMAATDTLFFFTGNVIALLFNLNPLEYFLLSLILVFFGIAITLCAKAMAYLVDNAADIQEENNGTI